MAAFPNLFGLAWVIKAFMLFPPSYQLILAALNTSAMKKASQHGLGLRQREIAGFPIAQVRPSGAIVPKLQKLTRDVLVEYPVPDQRNAAMLPCQIIQSAGRFCNTRPEKSLAFTVSIRSKQPV